MGGVGVWKLGVGVWTLGTGSWMARCRWGAQGKPMIGSKRQALSRARAAVARLPIQLPTSNFYFPSPQIRKGAARRSVQPADARLSSSPKRFDKTGRPSTSARQSTLVTRAMTGAAGRNRTDDTCLEGRGFTTKLQPQERRELRGTDPSVKPGFPSDRDSESFFFYGFQG